MPGHQTPYHNWTPAPDDWPTPEDLASALAELADWDRAWPDANACDELVLNGRQAKALIAEIRRLQSAAE
jgi:hypothetical protein